MLDLFQTEQLEPEVREAYRSWEVAYIRSRVAYRQWAQYGCTQRDWDFYVQAYEDAHAAQRHFACKRDGTRSPLAR